MGGLYFSVLLKPNGSPFLSNLTQLMALSICYALEELNLKHVLKWPNDVQVNGQKISGILSEAVFDKTVLQAVVLGVGINLEQEGLDNVGQPATSLARLGIHTERVFLLNRMLHFFWQQYPALCEKGFETIREDFAQRFGALGKEVRVQQTDQTIFGKAVGISPRGTLLLQTAQGLKEIYIGDLQA